MEKTYRADYSSWYKAARLNPLLNQKGPNDLQLYPGAFCVFSIQVTPCMLFILNIEDV